MLADVSSSKEEHRYFWGNQISMGTYITQFSSPVAVISI